MKTQKSKRIKPLASTVVRGNGESIPVCEDRPEPSFFSQLPLGEHFEREKESMIQRVLEYLRR